MEVFFKVVVAIQAAALIFCTVMGLINKCEDMKTFDGNWRDASLGEIILAILFLPSFIALLIIDYTPNFLAYKPFSKDKK